MREEKKILVLHYQEQKYFKSGKRHLFHHTQDYCYNLNYTTEQLILKGTSLSLAHGIKQLLIKYKNTS